MVDINTGSLRRSTAAVRSEAAAEPKSEQVSAFALSPTAAPSLTGGTITIQGRTGTGSQADSVTIDGAGSGIFTESTGSRPGGDINILTSQSVAMTNGASISASSTGPGTAGNININAGNQFAMTNSTVTTEANQSGGGAIKITTNPGGTVQLTDSTISASVLDGNGGGGSVNIDPQFVILQNSQIPRILSSDLAETSRSRPIFCFRIRRASSRLPRSLASKATSSFSRRFRQAAARSFPSGRSPSCNRAFESALCRARWWEHQQLHCCGTGQLAGRTGWLDFEPAGPKHG